MRPIIKIKKLERIKCCMKAESKSFLFINFLKNISAPDNGAANAEKSLKADLIKKNIANSMASI